MPTYSIRDRGLERKIIVLKPPAAGRFGRELIARLALCKPPQYSLCADAADPLASIAEHRLRQRHSAPTASAARTRTVTIPARAASQRSSQIAYPHSYTCTVVMKNIPLSVDENVLAIVRRHAAEHNSTVNALVREYFTGLAQHEDRARAPGRDCGN